MAKTFDYYSIYFDIWCESFCMGKKPYRTIHKLVMNYIFTKNLIIYLKLSLL